jgi:hypothetical protein
LPQARIDYFHSRIAKRSCDHFRPAIMSVKPRLGDKDADGKVHLDSALIIAAREWLKREPQILVWKSRLLTGYYPGRADKSGNSKPLDGV